MRGVWMNTVAVSAWVLGTTAQECRMGKLVCVGSGTGRKEVSRYRLGAEEREERKGGEVGTGVCPKRVPPNTSTGPNGGAVLRGS